MSLELSINSLDKAVLQKLTSSEQKKLLLEISQKFTSNRDKIGDYTNSKRHVSAYTYFYLPTNIPKYKFILNQLPKALLSDFSHAHFIDFGCGPGTFSLAHLSEINPNAKISLVDISSSMLEQAQKCLAHFFPDNKNISTYKLINEVINIKNDNEPKILFFGHTLNEIGVDFALEVIDHISADYIFFIAPGTPAVFADILKIRDELYKREYDSKYPCSVNRGKCPIAMEESEDWCHQILKMTHDPSIERLSQIIGKDRRTMPLIAQLFVKSKPLVQENITSEKLKDLETSFLVTRLLTETKFSYLLEVCLQENDHNKIQKLEIMKKSLSKKEVKQFRSLNTGVRIHFQRTKILDTGVWRGNIIL